MREIQSGCVEMVNLYTLTMAKWNSAFQVKGGSDVWKGDICTILAKSNAIRSSRQSMNSSKENIISKRGVAILQAQSSGCGNSGNGEARSWNGRNIVGNRWVKDRRGRHAAPWRHTLPFLFCPIYHNFSSRMPLTFCLPAISCDSLMSLPS